MDLQGDRLLRNYFFKERNWIHKHIESFLFVVLSYLVNFEERFEVNRELIAKKISKKFPLLIKSLCQIHGLYGYPATTKSEYSPDDEVTEIKPEAIKEIFKRLKKNDKTLGDYYKYAKEDEFWQFECLTDLVREPAHILLEMMKDLFVDPRDACKTTLELLGNLRDGNCLKPAYWAEDSKDPAKNCGFSLDVRPFVRSVYVYIKLRELREHHDHDNGVKLKDVNVYKCVGNAKACLEGNPTLIEHRSKYKKRKDGTQRSTRSHCKSCQIFFDGTPDKRREKKKSLADFGNCAEYDVIKTPKLNALLCSTQRPWGAFEHACKVHLEAFKSLTTKIGKNLDQYTLLREYFETTLKLKMALKYEWSSESYDYKLKAIIWEATIMVSLTGLTGYSTALRSETRRKRKHAEDEKCNCQDMQMLPKPCGLRSDLHATKKRKASDSKSGSKEADLSESEYLESEDDGEDGYDDGGYDYSRKEL